MRSPQTQGEDGDHGTSERQSTPFVGPMLMGGFAFSETPDEFGPRNWGQFPEAPLASPTIRSTRQIDRKREIPFTPVIERQKRTASNTRMGGRAEREIWRPGLELR